MGYQAESGTWRGLYLTAAQELRHGVMELLFAGTANPDSIRAMSLALLFNYLGVRLNGPEAADHSLTLNFVFTDTGENAVLELTNGSLNHSLDRLDPDPDVTGTLARTALDRVIGGKTTLPEEAESGEIKVEPDLAPLQEFLSMLDDFDPWFNIIEP
jgi:alkyl sulfatase BDS1-like metallo-beta-lactamase superfamily hydrolase